MLNKEKQGVEANASCLTLEVEEELQSTWRFSSLCWKRLKRKQIVSVLSISRQET